MSKNWKSKYGLPSVAILVGPEYSSSLPLPQVGISPWKHIQQASGIGNGCLYDGGTGLEGHLYAPSP